MNQERNESSSIRIGGRESMTSNLDRVQRAVVRLNQSLPTTADAVDAMRIAFRSLRLLRVTKTRHRHLKVRPLATWGKVKRKRV